MNDKSKEITLYAYVDEFLEFGYQDYFPYEKCLKLTTIIKDDYLNNSFNEPEGCKTQNIDINISDKNKDIMYRSIIFSYDKINLNLIKKLISIFEKKRA